MMTPVGPNLPVPTRRSARVERTGRADTHAGGEERRQSQPRAARADLPVQTASGSAEPGTPRLSGQTGTLLQLHSGHRPRGLRAEDSERRRYREAYARASAPATHPAAPRLERRA